MRGLIKAGRGSAYLIEAAQWKRGGNVYVGCADEVAERLGCCAEDLMFLDSLTNGGEKGAGLRVLQKALGQARKKHGVLVLFVLSEAGSDHDQTKLCEWYLGTGLLRKIPTPWEIPWLVDADYTPAKELMR